MHSFFVGIIIIIIIMQAGIKFAGSGFQSWAPMLFACYFCVVRDKILCELEF